MEPVVQWRDGAFQVRCPRCRYLLFISSVGTWRAVEADANVPRVAIKCPYRRGGEGRCGHVTVMTAEAAETADVTPVTGRTEGAE